MTDDKQEFTAAEECHICGQKYGNTNIKVRDHYHTTVQYCGSTHQDCNLKLRIDPRQF